MTLTSAFTTIKQHRDSVSQEQLRALWPLCRMPTMLPHRGRIPAPRNYPHLRWEAKIGQRMHRATMHAFGSARMHDGWGQALWMQTLSLELQPKKQKFLFWCRLSFDGALYRGLARSTQWFKFAFQQCTTSYIPARKKRPRFFKKQPRSWQDVLRSEENTQHCKFQQ